jgi:hypothetical protein
LESQLPGVLRLNSSLAPGLEKLLKTLVPEAFDHGKECNVSVDACQG